MSSKIKTAVTISLVPEAKGGPFVYWDGLENGCKRAAAAGFDAVEIFAPSADAIDPQELQKLLTDNNVDLAAVGTGAGWLLHKWSLTSTDSSARQKAQDFIKGIIDFAGNFSAPAIIGSMQGQIGKDTKREEALEWLNEGLNNLGGHASQYNVPLLYEPLNRYETNVCTLQADGAQMLRSLDTDNVKLLCDLFHMNIEEKDMGKALRAAGDKVAHIHFVDSNRRAPGFGHTQYAPIVEALNDIGFSGCLSAEALPLPDSDAAANQMIKSLREMELVDLS